MFSKFRFIQFAVFLLTLISAISAFADVKIKMRSSSGSGDAAYEYTTYIKGKRQRTEANGQTVSLMQCDLRRMVQLAPDAKSYFVTTFDQLNAGAVEITKTGTNTETAVVRGGTVITTYTTRDTGERKQMFGYTARRIIRLIETEPSPDACKREKSKMEIDSWVIDAEFGLACGDMNINSRAASQTGGCQDKRVVKNLGTGKPGFELYSKMTVFDESGKPTYSIITEAIELSKANLETALFEIPQDYRETKNAAELYAGATSSSTAGTTSSSTMQMPQIPSANGSSVSRSNSTAKKTPNDSDEVTTETSAKKTGVVRIGLAAVKTGTVGEGLNGTELSTAVQNTLAEYLKTPTVEIVRLGAKLPSAIDAEAKEKGCDFVIYTVVSHKKGGGLFGKALGKLSESVAGKAYGSSDHIGKATQITIMTAAAASGNVRAKDQITLEIKLAAPGNSSPVVRQFQAKAKSDGEDIITPIVEQAAQMVVEQAAKK